MRNLNYESQNCHKENKKSFEERNQYQKSFEERNQYQKSFEERIQYQKSFEERIQYLLETYNRLSETNSFQHDDESLFDELGLDFTCSEHFLDAMPSTHLSA